MLFFLLFSHFTCSYAQTSSQGLGTTLKTKCDAMPYPSYFDIDTLRCYIRSPISCNRVTFLGKLNYATISTQVNAQLKKKGVLKKGETRASQIFNGDSVCVFEFETSCGRMNQIRDDCFAPTESRGWHNAWNECVRMGARLLTLHRDGTAINAIRFILQENYKDVGFWTGSRVCATEWMNQDGSTVDYFRWAPNNTKAGDGFGSLLISIKSNQASSIRDIIYPAPTICHDVSIGDLRGYQTPKKLDEQFRGLCHREIIVPETPVKKPLPTVPTPATTPKPVPVTEMTNKQICEHIVKTNNIIHRAFNTKMLNHVYNLNNTEHTKLLQKGYEEEETVGYIVDEDLKTALNQRCSFKKLNIYERNCEPPVTWIGIEPNFGCAPSKLKGSLYCVKELGACGANQPVVAIPSNPPGQDIFYPSDEMEKETYSLYNLNYQNNIEPNACFVWKNCN